MPPAALVPHLSLLTGRPAMQGADESPAPLAPRHGIYRRELYPAHETPAGVAKLLVQIYVHGVEVSKVEIDADIVTHECVEAMWATCLAAVERRATPAGGAPRLASG